MMAKYKSNKYINESDSYKGLSNEDWEKFISNMQSCRFQFKVKVPYTDLSTLI